MRRPQTVIFKCSEGFANLTLVAAVSSLHTPTDAVILREIVIQVRAKKVVIVIRIGRMIEIVVRILPMGARPGLLENPLKANLGDHRPNLVCRQRKGVVELTCDDGTWKVPSNGRAKLIVKIHICPSMI